MKRPAAGTHVLHINNFYCANFNRLVSEICNFAAEAIFIVSIFNIFFIGERRGLRVVNLFDLGFVNCINLLESIHSRFAFEL